jgi:autotransporter-associated beta strand protein
MKTLNPSGICHHLRVALKPTACAAALAAALSIGSVQALTTSQTFDLGTSPESTNFPTTGIDSLVVWIPKGSLPTGSILRSVTATNLKLEAQLGNSWASNLGVFLDPTPETPGGPGGLLKIGDDNNYGGADNEMGWGGAQGDGPFTVSRSDTDWVGPIDLSTVAVMLGNGYAANTAYSGTITVVYDVPQAAAILSFGPGAVVGDLVDNAASIAWTVPSGTDVTALAPTFTLSSGAADKVSGGTYDFTNPVVYTVTDGETVNTYTVTVATATALRWNVAGGGTWDTSTENWLPLPSGPATTFANGAEAIFDNTAGGTIAIAPNMSPLTTTVSAASGTYSFVGGPIATGSLTKSGGGILRIMGVASIPPAGEATALSHTYPDGTVINGGRLVLGSIVNGLSPDVVDPVGSGPVTLNAGTIELQRVKANNALTLGGGTTLFQDNGWGATWSGPITLNGTSTMNTNFGLNFTGDVTGSGGFNKTGGGPLTLSGTNNFSGPVSVTAGVLQYNNASAPGSGALSISGSGKVNLNYSGTKTIASLTLGGVPQPNGSYGSLSSDALNKSAYFQGAGTVTVGSPTTFAFITSFGANVAGSTAVISTVIANTATIDWLVPAGTDLATLAPAFVLTAGATCSNQTSGNIPSPGFDAGPVAYSIVSEDSSVTIIYTVTVTVVTPEATLIWNLGGGAEWNYNSANWVGQSSGLPAVFVDGVNVIFSNTAGGTITVPLSVTVSPGNMTVNATSGTYRWEGGKGNIGGSGTLTKSGAGILKIGQPDTGPVIPMLNTFSGGTTIDGGELWLEPTSNTGLGTGPVTLNAGTLRLYRITAANNLTVNGGKLYTQNGFGNNWNGTVTLNATLPIEPMHNLTINGVISGSGGLTIQAQPAIVTLTAANDYAGPTSVTSGTLRCNSPGSLGSSALSISGTGKVNLSYIGTRTVASLTLGGVEQTTPGTYGSVASGANFQNDTYFTAGSTGTVTIAASGSDYDSWLAGFTFAEGADTTPTGDPDGDGMSNFEEYAFGLNPTLGSSVNPITQQLDPATGNFQYTRRATPATTKLTYTVLTSTTLGAWATGGATETGFTTAGDIQTVTVNVTTPPVDGKLFVRVAATPTP